MSDTEERPKQESDAPSDEDTQSGDGPDVSKLDQEPDYEPQDPGLKDLKGG